MKVTTEDCVQSIIEYFEQKNTENNSPLLDIKQWKRLSKSGKGDSIVRVFRNTKTTDLVNVTSSENEILSVSQQSNTQNVVTNFNNFTTPKKRTIKCKCKNCGSSDITLCISPSDGEDGYEKNPMTLNQKKAKKLVENGDESIWICHGDCEDETSAVVEIDGKKINNSDDFIEYIAEYGNPKIDDVDITNITKKKTDIIKAVKIGDLETVQEYIKSGKNLDVYIGDLPENKNKTGMGETNWTFLQYAIQEQQWDVAVEFINGGCDVNKPMKHIISTPLIQILSNKHKQTKMLNVIDALMTHGADLSIKSNGYNDSSIDGLDAFDWAEHWNKKPHMKYIIDNYPEQYKEYLSKK